MTTVRPTVSHMTREARMVLRGSTLTHQFLRARLTLLIALTLVVDAVGTVLMYWFEGGAKGSDFDDLGGALFWVTAQLTTVSSQMANPVTTPGRVLDILLEVWSISVVATAAGSFAAFFHARHLEGTRPAGAARRAARRRRSPGRASRGTAGGSPRRARTWSPASISVTMRRRCLSRPRPPFCSSCGLLRVARPGRGRFLLG